MGNVATTTGASNLAQPLESLRSIDGVYGINPDRQVHPFLPDSPEVSFSKRGEVGPTAFKPESTGKVELPPVSLEHPEMNVKVTSGSGS